MLVMMALKWIGLIGTMVCIDILPIKTNIKGSLLPVHTRYVGIYILMYYVGSKQGTQITYT